MKPVTGGVLRKLEEQGGGAGALVVFHITAAGGLWVFSTRIPPETLIGASGELKKLEGGWRLDGSIKMGEGFERLHGVHNWVKDAGRYTSGNPIALSGIQAVREKSTSGLTIRLANTDDADGHPKMGRIVAQHPLLNGLVTVRVGFEDAASTEDVIRMAAFRVREIRERGDEVIMALEAA